MSLEISTPATLLDMAELSGASSRLAWAVVREMHSGGQTWAIHDGDRLVAIAGLYPVDEVTGEAWFNIRPDAGRHMLSIVRAVRLTIRASPYREIVVLCLTGAGSRIARAAGFSFHSTTGQTEIWSCRNFSVETVQKNRWKRSSVDSSPT